MRKPWRLLLLVAVGAVLIAAAAAYKYLWISLPEGTGPAGPAVALEPFEQVWTERPVLLLGIGDSVTAGFGVPRKHSYFERLAHNPDDEWPDIEGRCLSAALPNLTTRNLAISGSTSLHHVDIIEAQLEEQPPEVFGLVVMTSGGNDLIHDYGRRPPREGAMYGATFERAKPWIDNFERRLGEMLRAIEARFPGGCMIFLADIYDPTDGLGDAATAGLPDWPDGLKIHAAYNDIIHRYGETFATVHVVPMHAGFLGHGIHCTQSWQPHYRAEDPHYWYAWNLEDPNARGFDALRRLFLLEMVEQKGRIGVAVTGDE